MSIAIRELIQMLALTEFEGWWTILFKKTSTTFISDKEEARSLKFFSPSGEEQAYSPVKYCALQVSIEGNCLSQWLIRNGYCDES